MSKRILIIDDDASMQMLLTETLTARGYEVDTAQNGRDGLEKLSAGGYDLVLLDVMLPNIDGIGILTELLAHPAKQKNGKIYLFTSLHDDPAVQEGLSKGADGFIVKSDIQPELLLTKIQELLH